MKNFVGSSWVVLALAPMLWATAAFGADAPAGRVTFTKDVLPILQENCQVCHRLGGQNMSGMIAPMSLMTFQEVRPWAKAMAKAVEEKVMPPWDASEKQHGVFANERTLTDGEIETILAWVRQGAARGNPADAPEPIEFREGWAMGDPDLVVTFPEPFFVADDVQDLYHNVTVTLDESMIPEDKWVNRIEFVPGSEVVHHIIAYVSNPKPGEETASGSGGDPEKDEEVLRTRVMIGGLAPGTDAAIFPEGFGLPIRKGAELTFALHYHKEAGPGTGRWDSSTVAFKFTDGRPEREMTITNIAHGDFEIPPNAANWVVSGARTFNEDVLLLSLMPHTHLRGVKARFEAHYPDGTVEELLDVPTYDFNWQSYYVYKEPKLIPKGTRVEYEAIYDNSRENAARNGFNSERAVRFGGPTTDEMDLGWYTFAPANVSTEEASD